MPIAGHIVDQQGRPLAGVTVILEVSRTAFSLRHLQQETGSVLRLPTHTDAQGYFRFDWTWQRHYNVFQLADRPRGDLRRQARLRDGAPPRPLGRNRETAPSDLKLTVTETGYLYWLRRLLGGQATTDEQRLYRENGRPGRIDDYSDGKSAWWYFEAGKVYRLASGVLEQTQSFTPIVPVP